MVPSYVWMMADGVYGSYCGSGTEFECHVLLFGPYSVLFP